MVSLCLCHAAGESALVVPICTIATNPENLCDGSSENISGGSQPSLLPWQRGHGVRPWRTSKVLRVRDQDIQETTGQSDKAGEPRQAETISPESNSLDKI